MRRDECTRMNRHHIPGKNIYPFLSTQNWEPILAVAVGVGVCILEEVAGPRSPTFPEDWNVPTNGEPIILTVLMALLYRKLVGARVVDMIGFVFTPLNIFIWELDPTARITLPVRVEMYNTPEEYTIVGMNRCKPMRGYINTNKEGNHNT